MGFWLSTVEKIGLFENPTVSSMIMGYNTTTFQTAWYSSEACIRLALGSSLDQDGGNPD